jgi:hypothetical protein
MTVTSHHSIPEKMLWIPSFCHSLQETTVSQNGFPMVWNTVIFWGWFSPYKVWAHFHEHLYSLISVGFLGTSHLLCQWSWKSAKLMVTLILPHPWHSLLLLNFDGSFVLLRIQYRMNSVFSLPSPPELLPWSPNLIIGCDFGSLLHAYHWKYYSPEKETHVNPINSYGIIWYLLVSLKSVHK